MIAAEQTRVRWHPQTSEDRALVRAELEKILSIAQFNNSKRYPAFLRYVVEKELSGQGEELKERTIGIDVFHRPPDYDTNNDTIVRFTAGEVRKRLVLFYHESHADHPIHILLPTGSYVPEFLRAVPASIAESAPIIAEPVPTSAPLSKTAPRQNLVRNIVLPLLVALAITAGVIFYVHHKATRLSALDEFWQPFTVSTVPVLICPGTVSSAAQLLGNDRPDKADDYPFVSVETATTLGRVTDLFGSRNIGYTVQPTPSTNLTELRAHPVVLIGGYTNSWALRLSSSLRFRFSPLPNEQIFDSTNPSQHWARFVINPDKSTDDFAIVARYRDSLTENWVIIIAGLGRNGTEAAAEFVTSSRYMEALSRNLPPDWGDKNLEMVIKTNVIDGKSGAPSVEAIQVW